MKKGMKKVLAVLTVLMMVVAIVGCGAKYKDSKYLGTWKGTKATYAGFTMGVEDIFGKFEFTLEDDGTCEVNVKDETQSGKWEETEKGIKFTDSSTGDLEFTDSKGNLVVNYSGVKIIFEKQK